MSKETKDKQGFVYVMSNPAYKKELLKVGFTTKTPEKRAKELFQTGVPDEFVVKYKAEFEDAKKAETQIHSLLKGCRYNERREFFTCGFRKTKKIVNTADGRIETDKNNDLLVTILIIAIIFLSVLLILSFLLLELDCHSKSRTSIINHYNYGCLKYARQHGR